MVRISIRFLLITLFTISALQAQVRSQWRGPERDGVYPNETLLRQWPAGGPELVWSASGFHEGFSSVAVTDDRVYVNGMLEGRGYLFALDHKGKQVWKTEYGPEWDEGHPGSRSTPTIVGTNLYMLSGMGTVYCINESDGKIKWQVDLVKEFGARNIDWGMTESILVDGDRLYCTPGGTNIMMAVLDRNTGKTIKKISGNGETSAYCSPCIVKHGNRRLILTMTGQSVVGIDADTDQYLWRYEHRTRYDINPNTPLYQNGFVYTNSGYGTGGQLFKLTGDAKSINKVWEQKTLDSQMGAVMLVDGYLYGSGHSNKGWHCLDWKTGTVQYSSRELGKKGNIIFSDGLLYCYSESGDVGLVKPDPEKFNVISSFKIDQGSGPHWAHPVIHKGRLYIRHGEALMVYNISRN